MTQETRCGTCVHWKCWGGNRRWGDCGAPLPASLYVRYELRPTSPGDGAGCPCWAKSEALVERPSWQPEHLPKPSTDAVGVGDRAEGTGMKAG